MRYYQEGIHFFSLSHQAVMAKSITYDERKLIQKCLEQGMSKRGIGRALDRPHSSILYEINQRSGDHMPYNAERAQLHALQARARQGNKKKLNDNDELREYVIDQLKDHQSPEQIAGRLKSIPELQDEAGGYVCAETIYAFLYSEEQKHLKLWQYLLRHRRKRLKRGTRKSKQQRKGGSIKSITPISERPKHIDHRSEAGHWESDSMIFSKQSEILSVQIERKSRYVRITKCANKTAQETTKALIDKLSQESAELLRTITFDRGTEAAEHKSFAQTLGVDVFFCDPYCSWQKGSVENANMFIRRYLPRDTDMSKIDDTMLLSIQDKINNRPLKCLGYRTAHEQRFYERFGRYPPPNKRETLFLSPT